MNKLLSISIFTFVAIYSIPSLGHHSCNGVYGNGEEVKLVATVVDSPRRNPHWAVDIEFTNDEGDTEHWVLEWRNSRNSGRDSDEILSLLRSGEDFEISGRKATTPGKNSIQIREITRLSDDTTAVASRY